MASLLVILFINFLLSLQLYKKRLKHRFFPVSIAKFLGTVFFKEHLRWLLLRMEACISIENPKLLYNTETNMYFSGIFKNSYFVQQPFLEDYLLLQKTVFCRSSLRGCF